MQPPHESPPTEIRHKTTRCKAIPSLDCWAESRKAEQEGLPERALYWHQKFCQTSELTYTAALRMGWLYFQVGNVSSALIYYQKAGALAPSDAWPLYGQRACHLVQENRAAAERISAHLNVLQQTLTP